MKKKIISLAVVALSLTSCISPWQDACWRVSEKVTRNGQTTMTNTYMWCTEIQASAYVDSLKAGYRRDSITDYRTNITLMRDYISATSCTMLHRNDY